MNLTDNIFEDTNVIVTKLVVGPFKNNVYFIRCKASGKSVLIDAADEHEKLTQLCRELNVTMVLETHGHFDHIQAVPQIRELGVPVYITNDDSHYLPSYDLLIDDDVDLKCGELLLHTIHTPGHTKGSVCFALKGTPLLFSGDTLFPGGPGATHFEDGDFPTIIDSIENRIFNAYSPTTTILPGHGSATTLSLELPHLSEWVERGW